MPAAKQMISGRCKQAAGFDCRPPGRFANLFNRLWGGQNAKIPCRTQAGKKIYLFRQRFQMLRWILIRIEGSIQPRKVIHVQYLEKIHETTGEGFLLSCAVRYLE